MKDERYTQFLARGKRMERDEKKRLKREAKLAKKAAKREAQVS